MKNNVRMSFWSILPLAMFGVALTRLIPHPYNFTPMVTLGILTFGAKQGKPWILAVPLLVWMLSDSLVNPIMQSEFTGSFISYLSSFSNWSAYIGFLFASIAGLFLSRKFTASRCLAASFTGSSIFYLVSNTLVWLGGALYPLNFAGWISALMAGVPFYHVGDPFSSFFLNQFIGDFFYMGIAIGIVYLVQSRSEVILKS
jgi:hypothetical protein